MVGSIAGSVIIIMGAVVIIALVVALVWLSMRQRGSQDDLMAEWVAGQRSIVEYVLKGNGELCKSAIDNILNPPSADTPEPKPEFEFEDLPLAEGAFGTDLGPVSGGGEFYLADGTVRPQDAKEVAVQEKADELFSRAGHPGVAPGV